MTFTERSGKTICCPPFSTQLFRTDGQCIWKRCTAFYAAPITPHAQMPVQKDHFERWIQLFHATLDDHFIGEVAEEARWRSSKMAEMFLYKIEYYREIQAKPLI